jgi:hypothetical protein
LKNSTSGNNICEVNRKIKFVDRSTYLVNICNSEHQKYLLLKTFNSLKYFTYNQKYLKTCHLLENENNRKVECEQTLLQLVNLNETKIKYQCFRRAFSRYSDVAYSAFSKWKEFKSYKTLIIKRLGNQLAYQHHNNLSDAFQVLRSATFHIQINELKKINKEIINDNSLIAHDIQKLGEKQNTLEELNQHIKELKLERCLNMTVRRIKRKSFIKLNKYAELCQVYEKGFNKMYKTEVKHQLKQSIDGWSENVKELKRFNYINTFLNNLEKYKQISMKSKCFNAFIDY